MRFIPYQHVEKWGSPLVEGIEKGRVSVFPKLDGKCTSVFNAAERLAIGGRRCEEDKQKSPHVFKHFDGTSSYALFVKEHPELVLYGEFGNKTTIGYYKKEVYGDFFVFDVVTFDENDRPNYMDYEDYVPLLDRYGIKYIPRIAVIENITEDTFEELLALATEHFVDKELAKGKQAEGFIVKNYTYVNKHGKQIWAKVVTDEYKARKHRMKSDGTVDTRTSEEIVVEETLTTAFIDKELQKFKEREGLLETRHIPKLFDYIWETWISEEILNMLNVMKKYKKDTFEPAELSKLMKLKVKASVPELFIKR